MGMCEDERRIKKKQKNFLGCMFKCPVLVLDVENEDGDRPEIGEDTRAKAFPMTICVQKLSLLI